MKLLKCFNLFLKGEAGEICSINFNITKKKPKGLRARKRKPIPIYNLKKKLHANWCLSLGQMWVKDGLTSFPGIP